MLLFGEHWNNKAGWGFRIVPRNGTLVLIRLFRFLRKSGLSLPDFYVTLKEIHKQEANPMTNRTSDIFQKDLFRYYGTPKETLRQRILRPDEIKFLHCFRKINSHIPGLLKIYYKLRLQKLSRKTHIQIPHDVKIGEGFYIGHCGRIIINSDAVLGKNINIATGVTIGQENRGARKGCPTIKDNVWIGTNAVIIGNITIGQDVLIAPLSYVNFDVPDHSIVVGNPGKIIPRENATGGYIERTV